MARKKRQQCQINLKRYNKTILYENKTWHVVHEQDGLSFAVQELRKGVVGGRVMPFAPYGLSTQRTDVIFI
jgi:hypothetical protein